MKIILHKQCADDLYIDVTRTRWSQQIVQPLQRFTVETLARIVISGPRTMCVYDRQLAKQILITIARWDYHMT